MILRGNIRGNAKQLGYYLLAIGENENVQILEVNGEYNANANYLHETIQSMGLMAEMTKSDKGVYHAQINPAYTEDKKMQQEDWMRAADILAQELGYQDQRRIIVLHEKKGRLHAHVVFERYDYQTGKLKDNKQSRLKQDNARKEMERVFEHKQTPHRNRDKAALKEIVTKLWADTKDGKEFLKMVEKAGLIVAQGTANRPYMIVDGNARSFDLVRQLQGIKTKEVRERLRHEKLLTEKAAIEKMRNFAETKSGGKGKSKQQQEAQRRALTVATAFAENSGITKPKPDLATEKRKQHLAFSNFIDNSDTLINRIKEPEQLKKLSVKELAELFFELKNDLSGKNPKNDEHELEDKIAELMKKNTEEILRKRVEQLLKAKQLAEELSIKRHYSKDGKYPTP